MLQHFKYSFFYNQMVGGCQLHSSRDYYLLSVTPLSINQSSIICEYSVSGGYFILVAFYCVFKNGRPRTKASQTWNTFSSKDCHNATLQLNLSHCNKVSLTHNHMWILTEINLQAPCKSVLKYNVRKGDYLYYLIPNNCISLKSEM
jgi:hypothetical protein